MIKTVNFEYPRAVMKICAEIIIIITEIPKRSSTMNLEDLHRRICAKFDSVIKQCKVNSLLEVAALELLYPLAALADETVLCIPQCRFFWSERLLQLRYFGEAAAGAKFFSRLEVRMKARNPQTDVLELYFIGLALGLKGMYMSHDSKRCASIFENLGIMLKNIRRKRKSACEDASNGRKKRASPPSKRAALMAYPAAVILIMIIAAVIYHTAYVDLLKFLVHF